MKYLINHRFRTLLELRNQVEGLLTVCDRGASSELMPALRKLQEIHQLLSPMKSRPFEKKQIAAIEYIETKTAKLISLPDNFSEVGKDVLMHCEKILREIEPFTLDAGGDLPDEIVKAITIIDRMKEDLCLILEKLDDPGADTKAEVKRIAGEMQNLSVLAKTIETEKERQVLQEFSEIWQLYEVSWGVLEFQMLHQSCEYIVRYLTNSGEVSEDELALTAILQNLEETFRKVESTLNAKEPSYSVYAPLLKSEMVQQQVKMLEEFEFEDEELTKLRDQMLQTYKNAAEEEGNSKASLKKSVEQFKLFGKQLKKLLSYFQGDG